MAKVRGGAPALVSGGQYVQEDDDLDDGTRIASGDGHHQVGLMLAWSVATDKVIALMRH